MIQQLHKSRTLNPIMMRFVDPGVERHYRDDQIDFRLGAVRVATIAMAGVWLTFIVLNILTIHDPSPGLYYIRASGLCINIAAFAATLILPPGRWIGPFGFAVSNSSDEVERGIRLQNLIRLGQGE